MELTGDLRPEALADAMPGRPTRWYPAALSTQADALAWARAGAPHGALVVADYQASPRGRGGLEWQAPPGRSLAFSLVLRPQLAAHREGWLYVVATSAFADAVGEDARIEWPDEVRLRGRRAGAVGVDTELGPAGIEWAVVNVLVADATPPRTRLLARMVETIESRLAMPSVTVLAEYVRRCETIGRRVCARMIPLGPAGIRLTGTAARVLPDGALVLETDDGRRLAVRAQNLGLLEDAE